MADMNVNYSNMETVAKQLISGKQDIENQLTALKKSVDTLVARAFKTDQASGAFESAYTEFNTGVTQTIEGLEGMSKFLTAAHTTLQQTDEALAKALKN